MAVEERLRKQKDEVSDPASCTCVRGCRRQDGRLLSLRIFEDDQGKTNRSLADVDGGLLLISQFTLYANCRRGNRPSFIEAGSPQHAEEIYQYIVEECRKAVPLVQTGIFGADMKVSLLNDGPFTILLDEHAFAAQN